MQVDTEVSEEHAASIVVPSMMKFKFDTKEMSIMMQLCYT